MKAATFDPLKFATWALTQEWVPAQDTMVIIFNEHIIYVGSFPCVQYIPGILWVMMVNPSQAPVCKQGRDKLQ